MRRATGTGAGPDRTRHPASLAVLRADHRSRGLPPAVRPVLVALLAGLHQPGLADPGGAAARGYRTPRPSHVPPRMLEELSPTAGSTRQPPGGHPAAWVRTDADQLDLTLTDHDQLLLVPSHFVWQS